MLEGARMAPRNRSTYTILKDNGLIYIQWGREIFPLSIEGALTKIIEEHCIPYTAGVETLNKHKA